jgi:hypothetical protein
MATLNELIYDVRERHNAYSDDSNLSDEHIAFNIKNFRNTLLQQYMSNLRHGVPMNALQVICLDMEIDKQCFDKFDVIKSMIKIPKTVNNTGRSDIHRIHTEGSRFTKNINVIDYGRLPFISASRYIGSQLYISIDQFNHLIAYNTLNKHILLETLQLEGVFEDIELAYDLSCEKNELPFEESKFPMPEEMITPLINQVSNTLLNKKNIPIDNQNNAEDVVTGGGTKTRE